MIRGKKTISCSQRPIIEKIKGYIRDTTRPFDGDGYTFKTAVKELRKEGLSINYIIDKCHYIKTGV